MKRWWCPYCGYEKWAIAIEVGHRCTRNRNRWVWFRKDDDR